MWSAYFPPATSTNPRNDRRDVGSLRRMDEVGRCESCGDAAVSVVAVHRIYLTPEANRDFGDYAYDRIRARW